MTTSGVVLPIFFSSVVVETENQKIWFSYDSCKKNLNPLSLYVEILPILELFNTISTSFICKCYQGNKRLRASKMKRKRTSRFLIDLQKNRANGVCKLFDRMNQKSNRPECRFKGNNNKRLGHGYSKLLKYLVSLWKFLIELNQIICDDYESIKHFIPYCVFFLYLALSSLLNSQ